MATSIVRADALSQGDYVIDSEALNPGVFAITNVRINSFNGITIDGTYVDGGDNAQLWFCINDLVWIAHDRSH